MGYIFLSSMDQSDTTLFYVLASDTPREGMTVQVESKYWTFPGTSQVALKEMKKPYGPIDFRWALSNIIGFNNVQPVPEKWFGGDAAAKYGSPRFQSKSNNRIDIRIVPYEVVLMLAKSA